MDTLGMDAARFIIGHAAEPITLRDIADEIGYSPFHFARAFEREIGIPPGKFVAAQRFQRAKRLLLHTDAQVIEVCHAVGFSSVGTFTTRFAAAVGCTPTEFRGLPEVLHDAHPRPRVVAGDCRRGAFVSGTARLSRSSVAALGSDAPAVYLGLYPQRSAAGAPVSGALLVGTDRFTLVDVPPGTYWLLASALPLHADPQAQLMPGRSVIGICPRPVTVTGDSAPQHRDVLLDVAAEWALPVLVALPALATAQDRRSARAPADLKLVAASANTAREDWG
jgi:AraC-like DNA-binding protein